VRPYVETWRGVGGLCGRSERWCRQYASRAERPLPVFKIGGIVRMYVDELERWMVEEAAAHEAARQGEIARLKADRAARLAAKAAR
jgi:uncharacterized small protein (DUF1192 family)